MLISKFFREKLCKSNLTFKNQVLDSLLLLFPFQTWTRVSPGSPIWRARWCVPPIYYFNLNTLRKQNDTRFYANRILNRDPILILPSGCGSKQDSILVIRWFFFPCAAWNECYFYLQKPYLDSLMFYWIFLGDNFA